MEFLDDNLELKHKIMENKIYLHTITIYNTTHATEADIATILKYQLLALKGMITQSTQIYDQNARGSVLSTRSPEGGLGYLYDISNKDDEEENVSAQLLN